jgi:transposase
MPKLLIARPPLDAAEERTVRRLATSRHAPADWILRARMIAQSWAGWRTTAIAAALHCHPQTVRERILRFNVEGVDGLGDRPGRGRKRRLTEAERSTLIALVRLQPPGRPVREGDGSLTPTDADKPAHWSLDALVQAAQERGIQIQRSQVRRILRAEGVPWRRTRTWATSTDAEFGPKEPPSSRATLRPPRTRRRSVSTNSGQ